MNDLLIQDQEARRQALDASQSFIVQAPAGSGKTELLIQRCLTLLKHVKSPEEILAITFTKKAANEMRTRVINALKAAQEPEPESAHAKLTWQIANQVLARDAQLGWNIINNPNRLRIQTIDSLCAYLTRQLPLLSHFGSAPDIAQQPSALYKEAVKEILLHVEENYAWSKAVSHLLLHLDNDFNKLHELLVSLLQKRDQWLPFIALDMQYADIRQQLEYQLRAVISDSLRNLWEIFPTAITQELLALARYAGNNLIAAHVDDPVCTCAELHELPGTDAEDKKYWLGLAKLLLTGDETWRKRLTQAEGFPAPSATKNPHDKKLFDTYKKRMSALLEGLADNDKLRMLLAELYTLPDQAYSEHQWEILQSMLVVLKIIAAQLRVSFQQYGQIDFIENAQAALMALGNDEHPTDLALALDYQIRHILVDEFQDTSYTQYQLVEKLTAGWEDQDGRTLFVVGDPMQSIYRFRQAEVGLFIRMRRNGIGNIRLKPLTLSVNFRSLTSVVDWNNALFNKIFPSFNDIATGAVRYSASIAHNKNPSNEAQIAVHGIINADEVIQAARITACIEQLRHQHPDEQIAILVRSRPSLSALIPALKKAKIPYKAVEIDPLASRQHIQDLLSLTCALLHPADRIAWLAILRAPWCGLTLSDLLVIAGSEPKAIIWQRINCPDVLARLSEDGRLRLQRILPVLKDKLAERERYDLRSWIENTWLLLGGPAGLDDRSEMQDAREYFDLLTEFTQSSRILNIERLKEKIAKLFATAQHNDSAVQIMTIHAAKGLEFDTVILPSLERKITSDDKSLLQWMDRPLSNNQSALLLAPIHATGTAQDAIYEYINRQERVKGNYEIDRLLYVAATRAKKRLYLFFNLKEKDGVAKPESNSFLARLWPLIENNYECERLEANVDAQASPDTRRMIKRAAREWTNPVRDTTEVSIAYHHKQNGFQLTNEKPKIIGIVLHAVLQQISVSGTSWWRNIDKRDSETYLRFHLQQQGLPEKELDDAAQTAMRALENALGDERGAWILQPHEGASSEFALTAIIEGKPQNLIIDRTFIDADGTRWIIDYKTAALTHQDLEQFLNHEQEKYLEKMRVYQQAMALLDPRPIRLGLYFPALPAWRELAGSF